MIHHLRAIVDLTGQTPPYFPWDDLPPEIKCAIAFCGLLSCFDILRLAMTSKTNFWHVLGGTVKGTEVIMLPLDVKKLYNTIGNNMGVPNLPNRAHRNDWGVLDLLGKAIENDWGVCAVRMLQKALDTELDVGVELAEDEDKEEANQVRIDLVLEDIVTQEAWNVFLSLSNAGLFGDLVISSTMLNRIHNFEVWKCILDNHPVKWMRSSQGNFWWALPHQIAFFLGHPNFPSFDGTPLKRVLEVAVSDHEPRRKKRKALSVSRIVDKFGLSASPETYFPSDVIVLD